jgi:Glycosyl transferases group 1
MKVAFLANSYHLAKTHSSQFFIDLLRNWFENVTVIPHEDAWTRMPGRWDLVVVWQHWFGRTELEAFGSRSVVLVPMFDECPLDFGFWSKYKGCKVLCFSQTLADRIEPWGFECLRVSYRPPVPSIQAAFGELRGFFWPRTTALDWRHVGPLVRGTSWASFHLHTAHVAPGAILPDETEVPAQKFVRTDWFERSDAYSSALAEANVFFAPRRQEGIGMATLEALALGMAVVAPDAPTANEYITSGLDGFLYDPEDPGRVDWSRAADWGRAARQGAVEGRRDWENQLALIRQFLKNEPLRPFHRWRPAMVLRRKALAWLREGYRWGKQLRRKIKPQ